MTPEDIELLFQSRNQSQGIHDEDEETISEKETTFRVQQLKEILLVAHNAWVSGSEELDYIAEKLADGSRDASWRVPIGDSGLLDFFLSILHVEGLRQHLLIHALRLIGNSCADTDENRARVVQSKQIPSIVKLSSDDSLLPFVIPVVYNVCVDYEPAQLEACNACLSRVLVEIIRGPRLNACRPFLNIICKILKLLISQGPEANLANPATATYLLNLAVSRTYPPDLEDYCGLTSVALAYLTHEQFQASLLNGGYCELLMQCFEDSYGRFDIANIDPEDTAELKQIWAAFVQIFADISASPYFATLPLGSPLVQRLVRWLGSPSFSYPHLQTAACLSLGNLARSDEASTALLKDVYGPISALLTSMSPPAAQLLHAVLSFLKNLAIPATNKPILGRLLLEPPTDSILSRLWSTETQPQTQFAAISLTRLLVSGCPANVGRLCTPLSPDPSSPAHERTNLHLLISVANRADAEPTKFEVARTVAAACKVLHSPYPSTSQPLLSWGPDSPDNSSRQRFYSVHQAEISKCLADLLTQHRFPALRSESLFVMALMSRSADGAEIVCRALHPMEVSGALVEAVTGRNMADGARSREASAEFSIQQTGGGGLDAIQGLGLEPQQASLDPAQAASMSRIDRENGLVLVAELLRQDASVVPQFRRSVFEEMLKTGGEMVLNERQERGEDGDAS
ncbi:hypothetical protein CONLIGDRAFT_102596 [Coniochaeta ligniaria NRRL 30616]|uniref:ARM repeat-containing protein n=1 Tax=Coniochaeta ligniaria NRRL 30616 TaxID=1408157 RepID=A0A1J7J693_9PEZI|nr:hypothetical protein CONLIGDRAFT_102596 [Coniochaeta ligniaria NRRL 30616]